MAKRGKPQAQKKVTTSARELSRVERDNRVLRLRKDKWTITEIAEDVGLSRAGVHAILVREMGFVREDTREMAAELRAAQLEQLQAMREMTYRRALSTGDAGDVGAFNKTVATEADIAGTKAAAKSEISGVEGGAIETKSQVVHALDMSSLSVEQLLALESLANANAAAFEDEGEDE